MRLALLAAAFLTSGCGVSRERDSADGAAEAVPSCPINASACAGPAEIAGSTPFDTFAGAAATAVVADTCGNSFAFTISSLDRTTCSKLSILVKVTRSSSTDTAALVGAFPATATYRTAPSSPEGARQASTTGIVRISAADEPAATGNITGSVEFSNDGFSLVGPYSSPYCIFTDCSLAR